jgi:hypothetical protein
MGRSFHLLIILSAMVGASLHAAPSISLSANSLAVDANATLTHTITGIASGETVTVERFADVNNNGAIDFGEPALRSFVVQDGVRTSIGGVVNGNVPGDNDGAANGAIRIDLPFPGVDVILNRQPGNYIVRVNGASGSATAALAITAPNLPQRVTGVLKNSANNATIPFGIIVVLVGDGMPIGSVRTDATGAFNFIAPVGDYGLIPVADGFAAPFQFVSIPANQTVTQNLMLTPAAARISGKLSDATTGAGLSSIFILGQSGHDGDGDISGALTDSNGNFAFNVTAGAWEIRPMSEQAAQIGYVVDEAGPTVTATTGPVTQNLTARKATALIHGRVTNPSSAAVANLPIRARQRSPLNLESFGRTAANGDYFVGVLAGSWELSTDGGAAAFGYREVSENVTAAANTATHADITLSAATAFVRGRVVNSSGSGIPNVEFQGRFENSNNSSSSTMTGSDGSFELPVWGGNWTFELGEDGVIDHQVNLTIVDGVDRNIGDFVVPNSTGNINVSVKNSAGNGVSGVFVYAQANINGVNYNSSGETDSNGSVSLPAINGSWSLSLSCGDLEDQNYNCPGNQNATVSNNDPTVNFTLQNFVTTASLNGRVVDASGAPLSGIQVGAHQQSGGTSRSAFSQADGSFSIPVFEGNWNLHIVNSQSYISPMRTVSVTNGVNVNNLELKLYATDATITGTVKNSAGAPLSGFNVYASAVIDGFTYSVPFAVTDAAGSFSFAVSRGSWSVNLDCNQLTTLQYNCSNIPAVDTTSGSAVVNITVTSQGPPQIEAPTINQSGQIPIFRFTLRGVPGSTYDILGSPAIPFTWTQVTATQIPFGGSTATPEFNPGTNRFFKVQLRQ